VLLVALVLLGVIGILFGMQSHLGKIYTNANSQMGMADCAASCSGASSGGGAAGGSGSGGSGGSAAAASGSSGTGSGGIVLGDDAPTNTPDASAGGGTGSGGGAGGSQPQPGIHIPTP
jgi:type IV secretion system protein TrbL